MARTIRDSWGNEHGPRRGLEGPFKRPDGSVVYYDPRYQGGRYWDPLSDMYLDRDVDPFRRSASVIDPAMFDKLRPGQRLWMTVSSGMQSGEQEFEVGRTTFSKKYNVYSKQLFPVENGVPLKRGRAKWVMFKRDSGVSVSHGGMGTVVKNIRVASEDEELRSNLIRLAHANPELRPKLLPLIKMASYENILKNAPWVPQSWRFSAPPSDAASNGGSYSDWGDATGKVLRQMRQEGLMNYVDKRGKKTWYLTPQGAALAKSQGVQVRMASEDKVARDVGTLIVFADRGNNFDLMVGVGFPGLGGGVASLDYMLKKVDSFGRKLVNETQNWLNQQPGVSVKGVFSDRMIGQKIRGHHGLFIGFKIWGMKPDDMDLKSVLKESGIYAVVY